MPRGAPAAFLAVDYGGRARSGFRAEGFHTALLAVECGWCCSFHSPINFVSEMTTLAPASTRIAPPQVPELSAKMQLMMRTGSVSDVELMMREVLVQLRNRMLLIVVPGELQGECVKGAESR